MFAYNVIEQMKQHLINLRIYLYKRYLHFLKLQNVNIILCL